MKEVTDEHVHDDSKQLPGLIENIIKSDNSMIPIGKLFANDGAYEGNEIFKFLADSGILPCIKVRKNSRFHLKKRKHALKPISPGTKKLFTKMERGQCKL
jgi:hypothetical protein